MITYSIWTDTTDPWDADNIRAPEATVQAFSEFQAAETFAQLHGFGEDEMYLIIRNEATQMYFRFEMVKEWSWSSGEPVHLKDLCSQ